ncbi:hypothetical protein M5K25_019448 [Dendrobium thyrsiflorum]|uniref:Peroxidase n=1 Tax=Dendrobium thyrsiflorum TaxID=117978 RepID=A0ABD0UFM9_DENTH
MKAIFKKVDTLRFGRRGVNNYLASAIAVSISGFVEDDVLHIGEAADDVEEKLRVVLTLSINDGVSPLSPADLKLNFYYESCPNAENFVFDYVKEHIPHAPTLAAPLLRMHFHDCFVRGCDGSILINSTSKNQAEKAATPNFTLRGFDFIDNIKSLLEEKCPNVVSCADILALTARDAVAVIGGPYWTVPTGRRDGLVSNVTEALNNIPAPNFNFSVLLKSFASRGLDMHDLVLLSALTTTAATKAQILQLVYGPHEVFFNEFAQSMEKMGKIEVKTGKEGEIRKHCAVVNG